MTERIELVKKILNAAHVDDYRIAATKTESHELFFVHKALETVRSTDTLDIKVTVFARHDGKLGDATFSVYASYDEAAIANAIEAAKKRAILIDNEPYPLPEGERATFESGSNFSGFTVSDLAARIADAVYAADHYEDGSVNALEIFLYCDTVRILNSRGIDKTETRHRAMVEAIPTWNGEESVELYECYNFTEYSFDNIFEEMDRKMREVRDRLAAKKPETKLSCPVVLGAPELSSLIEDLVYELNYSKVYSHANAFSLGDAIQKDPTGDALRVTMCGQMTDSVRAAHFDADGFTLRDTKVIDNGKAESFFGSVRFASYLGMEPTGNLSCARVETGTLTDEALKKAPYFRCASMSGIQVDIYNDYIGGEVRLGYYFDGEREIPVTGVSISGKLSDALSSLRLSDTATTYEAYRGPKLACLFGIEIV